MIRETIYCAVRLNASGDEEADLGTTAYNPEGARARAAQATGAWAKRYPVQRVAALRLTEIVEDAP